MSYVTKSVQTISKIVNVVLGGGFSTPTDVALEANLHLGFNF
jgi:hypothetical protein